MTIAATESETPRVSAALAATLESCGWLKREVHGPLVDLARELEREVAHWQIVARYNQATSPKPDATCEQNIRHEPTPAE